MPKNTSDQGQAKVNKVERIVRHLSLPPGEKSNNIILNYLSKKLDFCL